MISGAVTQQLHRLILRDRLEVYLDICQAILQPAWKSRQKACLPDVSVHADDKDQPFTRLVNGI